MEPMEESWQNYERQRRRLNARLGLMVFALLPLPAILIAVGLSPLKMVLAVASLGMSIGILYPMWWRTKHNPLRASAVEARTRRIAWSVGQAGSCAASQQRCPGRSEPMLRNGLLWHLPLR